MEPGERLLSRQELKLFNDEIFVRFGLFFRDNKIDFVSKRLLERLKVKKIKSFREYYKFLKESPGGEMEYVKLLDLLTIKETSFFRNTAHFEVLKETILPELKVKKAGDKKLTVWSAGCSSGEEPYSIAIVLLEIFGRFSDWDIKVIGSDISTAALLKAKRGVYSEKDVLPVPERLRKKYFSRQKDRFELVDEVRKLVEFRYTNIINETFLLKHLDIVFCRNVIIYFRDEIREAIIRNFHRSLNRGGYLFLGHAETIDFNFDGFEFIDLNKALVYKKVKG